MGLEQCHIHPKILAAKNVGIVRYPAQFWKRVTVLTALTQEKDIEFGNFSFVTVTGSFIWLHARGVKDNMWAKVKQYLKIPQRGIHKAGIYCSSKKHPTFISELRGGTPLPYHYAAKIIFHLLF